MGGDLPQSGDCLFPGGVTLDRAEKGEGPQGLMSDLTENAVGFKFCCTTCGFRKNG